MENIADGFKFLQIDKYIFFNVYNILMNIIMINIFAGIIIDKFVELREKEQRRLADMKGMCFICGLKQ